MNFQTFIREITNEVKKKLPEDLLVEVHTVHKNNGKKQVGLCIRQKSPTLISSGHSVSPVVYLESYYDVHLLGKTMEWIAGEIVTVLLAPVPVFHSEVITDWSYARERVVFRLVNKEMNRELLEDTCYREYLDLVLIYGIYVENESIGAGFIRITRQVFEGWQVMEEEVYVQALENTKEMLGDELASMNQLLLKRDLKTEAPDDAMYVLSNYHSVYGAAAMIYSGKIRMVAMKLSRNLCILPSSVHEVILIPDMGADPAFLKEMVRNVNETELKEDEILSDSVYYYDRFRDELRIIA